MRLDCWTTRWEGTSRLKRNECDFVALNNRLQNVWQVIDAAAPPWSNGDDQLRALSAYIIHKINRFCFQGKPIVCRSQIFAFKGPINMGRSSMVLDREV